MDAVLQAWPVLAGIVSLFVAMAGLLVGLFRWLRADIRRLEGRMDTEIREVRDTLRSEIREVRGEIVSLREDVVAVKVEIGFIKGKLDLLERYIMRRNDPVAEPAE